VKRGSTTEEKKPDEPHENEFGHLIDPETGYIIDRNTGDLLNPETGEIIPAGTAGSGEETAPEANDPENDAPIVVVPAEKPEEPAPVQPAPQVPAVPATPAEPDMSTGEAGFAVMEAPPEE